MKYGQGLNPILGNTWQIEGNTGIAAIVDSEKTARLFAAAPMLVESLQELVNTLVGEGLGELTVVENAREIISSAIKGGEL